MLITLILSRAQFSSLTSPELVSFLVFIFLDWMSSLEFLTAFRISKFEIRILGYEVSASPTLLSSLDEKLCPCFEIHHGELRQVHDGFHFLESAEVSENYILVFQLVDTG